MSDILLQILGGVIGLIPVLLIFLIRELRDRKKYGPLKRKRKD